LYSKTFEEIKELGSGSFGIVFKVKRREDSDYYSAIKRIDFFLVDKNEIIREYLY
jgi:hypothetical protein